MRQENGGRVGTKIGLWDEISLIAGWEEQKQLIVKNSGQNQCKKYFQQTITTLFAMSLRIKQRERVVAVEGQKSVCGMKFPISSIDYKKW